MFANYDAVEKATVEAAPALLHDRERYRPFFEAAEHYAAKMHMFVAGAAAAKMLAAATSSDVSASDASASDASEEVAAEDYIYDFYSPHGSAHARGLADCVFAVDPAGLGRYTTLLTNVPQYNWIIMVNGRRLFTVTALPVAGGVRTAGLVARVGAPRMGLFGAARLATVGYELALIDAYRGLCQPAKLAELGAALATESALRAAMLQERAWVERLGAVRDVRGGASKKHIAIADLRKELEKFVAGPARVVVGWPAVRAMETESFAQAHAHSHLHSQTYVTANKLEDEWVAIERLAHRAGVKISASIDDPRMPGDLRLRRLIVRAAHGDMLITAYNTGSYELIPYFLGEEAAPNKYGTVPNKYGTVPNKYGTVPNKYGTVFVVMRFALVDWWFAALGRASAPAAESRAATEEACALFLGASVTYYLLLDALDSQGTQDAQNLRADVLAKIVSADSYAGRDEDAEVALKRAAAAAPRLAEEAAMDAPRFYRAYMPAEKLPLAAAPI
jgi:hypothetical protein